MRKNGKSKLIWLLAFALLVTSAGMGYAPREAAAIGTVYYVDAVTGDDTNDGQSPSDAWQSIARVNQQSLQPGDLVLLKNDSIWYDETLVLDESGTSGSPIVIGRYGGTSSRPILDVSPGGNGVDPTHCVLINASFIEIYHLECTGATTGIYADLPVGETEYEHIHIKGTYIHDTSGTGIYLKKKKKDVVIAGNTVSNTDYTAPIDDQFSRELHRWYGYGIFVNSKEGYYTDGSTTAYVADNYVENTDSGGIQVSFDAENTLIEYNTVNTFSNIHEYNIGIWADGKENVVQYNEVYNGASNQADGQAFDVDRETESVVYQYNYSHDNGSGFLSTFGNAKNWDFRYNLSVNDGSSNDAIFELSNDGAADGRIYNNTVYSTTAAYMIDSNDQGNDDTSGITFKNNIFHGDGSLDWFANSFPVGGEPIVDHNIFFQATVPSYATNTINGDPQFTKPGAAALGRSAAAAMWDLKATSPAIDAAASITDNGGKDFIGRSISNHGTPDIGALEYYANYTGNIAENREVDSSGYLLTTGTGSAIPPIPQYATDGDPLSRWESTEANNQWVSVDLGKETVIDRVLLNWGSTYATGYKVEISNDGTSWSSVYTTSSGNGSTDDIALTPVSTRYVRVYITARSGSQGVRLNEMEVYAADPSKVDGTSGSLSVTGSWSTQSNPNDYNGSIEYSDSTTSSISYTFTGSEIRYAARKGPGAGRVDVYIDGNLAGDNIDLYNSTAAYQQIVFQQNWLTEGTHTIKIVPTGTKNAASSSELVNLDYFEVR